jgi:hypothetical protein
MHRGYTRRWLQNKRKNVHVRSFQELDLNPGVAGVAGLYKLPDSSHDVIHISLDKKHAEFSGTGDILKIYCGILNGHLRCPSVTEISSVFGHF